MNSQGPCKDAFTETLLELAQQNKNIIAVTSDARGSVGLSSFIETLPNQFIEVGIAEQNEISIAAGLAKCGKRPFVCAPACFLCARSLEQIKVDVGYSNSNVKIIGVSGGISYGALGMSHHSLHDIAVMRALYGIMVFLPCDARQTRKLTQWLAESQHPAYVRMGRNAVEEVYSSEDFDFVPGKANLLRSGNDITLIACGEMVRFALDAAEILSSRGIEARVLDMHTLKPFDEKAVLNAAQETGMIVTVEEHSIFGGLGSAVAEITAQHSPVPVHIMGIPDEIVITGKSSEVFNYYGLDAQGIVSTAESLFKTKKVQ